MKTVDANDFEMVKECLMQKFRLTKEGFRQKFRTCRPEKNETPEQFVAKISKYFERWMQHQK